MRGDPEEDVLEVREGRDVHQLAALDERVQERGAAGALEAAREEPVLAGDRDDAELILGAVVVDGQAPVLDIPLQGRPLIGEIADRLAHGRRRQDGPREILAHGVDLREQGRGALPAERLACVARQVGGGPFDLIELLDEGDHLRRRAKSPAPDFRDGAAPIEAVIPRIGIRLQGTPQRGEKRLRPVSLVRGGGVEDDLLACWPSGSREVQRRFL